MIGSSLSSNINLIQKKDIPLWLYGCTYVLMLVILGLGHRIHRFPYLSYALPFFLLTVYLSFRGKLDTIWNVIGNKYICYTTIGLAFALHFIRIFLKFISVKYSIFDTGIFSNSICNFTNGHGFYSSILQVPQLSDHFCPNLLFLSPIFYIFPDGIILIIIRLAGFIYSIYLVGKLSLIVGIPTKAMHFIRLCWTLNLGMYGVLGYEFQPSELVIPFIFLMMIFYLEKKYTSLILCCILILGFKEQTSIIIIFLGTYIFFIEKNYGRGFLVGLLGLSAGLLIFFVVTPWLANTPNIHASYFGPLANIPEKLNFIWLVLSSTGFISLVCGIKYFILLLPGMAFNLVTNQLNATTFIFHYQDIACTISFCTTIVAMGQKDFIFPKNYLYKAFFSLAICTMFFVNNKFPSHYFTEEQLYPNRHKIAVWKNIQKLRKTKYADYALYTQDCIGFHFSDKFKLATFGSREINQNENHCILLADSLNPWPLNEIRTSVTFYEEKVKEGKYVQLKEFEPLLVFANAVEIK